MEGLCVIFPIFLFAMTLGLVGAAIVDGRESRERWGSVASQVRRGGAGAYRESLLTERRFRGVPVTVWISGVLSAVLAPFTGLICAPLGVLFMVMTSSRSSLFSAPGTPETALALVTLLVALSGLALPFGLWRSARRLMTCAPDAPSVAAIVGAWSLVHHGVIGLAWSFPLVLHDEPGALFAVVPAAFGALHAVVTIVAGSVTRRVQSSLSPEEYAELPLG